MPGYKNRRPAIVDDCKFCGEEPMPGAVLIKGQRVIACADCAHAAGVSREKLRSMLSNGDSLSLHHAVDAELMMGTDPDSLVDDLRFAIEDKLEELTEKMSADGVTTPMERAMKRRRDAMRRIVSALETL
jgi:hypothetical protein